MHGMARGTLHIEMDRRRLTRSTPTADFGEGRGGGEGSQSEESEP